MACRVGFGGWGEWEFLDAKKWLFEPFSEGKILKSEENKGFRSKNRQKFDKKMKILALQILKKRRLC